MKMSSSLTSTIKKEGGGTTGRRGCCDCVWGGRGPCLCATPFSSVRSKFTHMAELELKVKSLLQAQGPQTLEEASGGVSSELNETEFALTQLLSDCSIVSRDITTEEDEVKLYWRKAAPELRKWPTPETVHLRGIRPPSQKSRMPFKSPARTPTTNPATPRSRPGFSRKRNESTNSTGMRLADEIQRLRVKLDEVEGEIKVLAVDHYCEDELQVHINKLHEYNEIKDIGQLLLGKIAEVEGTTTATLYDKFGLGLDD